MHECLRKQTWGWLRDGRDTNTKNIANCISYHQLLLWKYSVMFLLRHGINRNKSIANTAMGITTDMNRFLKKDQNNGSYPHPSLQCSCSLPHRQAKAVWGPMGWESLLHEHPTSSESPHTQHNSRWATSLRTSQRESQHRAGKLKLKQGANKCALKEMEK